MRADSFVIADMVPFGARVLDLGCGDGSLLAFLQREKQVRGYGLEIDPHEIACCLERGVDVMERDLNRDLHDFETDSFDMVVLAETLQAVQRPDLMLDEMLRIGRECIVTFPNMGHLRCRLHLLVHGRMPVVRHLPCDWFDTPNIHLCTIDDFERLVTSKGHRIVRREVMDIDYVAGRLARWFPNLFGACGIYQICRGGVS